MVKDTTKKKYKAQTLREFLNSGVKTKRRKWKK